ncbi:MAG: hypothetical protein JSR19_12900 [Proteobacteria bacterium]|nr:hypothetical protein [Pseudomonadota bacterium]HQR03119.1 Coq4 family protein [Rhodocyclaceae bacterium]
MDDFSSLGVQEIFTNNSILVSSSRYLNHPLMREALATAMLRRNGRERRVGWDSTPIVRAYRELRDAGHINTLLAEERRINPQLDRWLEEKFIATYTRTDLEKYAAGTLGNIYFNHLVKMGFDIDLDPNLRRDRNWRPGTDLEYYETRAAQCHDFEHLMAGTGFDFLAEIPAFFMRIENAFRHFSPELAGELSAIHLLLILPMISRTMLHYPRAWPVVSEYMRRGMEIGRNSGPFLLARYEDLFHLTIPQVRKTLGIPPQQEVDNSELANYWSEGAQYGTMAG